MIVQRSGAVTGKGGGAATLGGFTEGMAGGLNSTVPAAAGGLGGGGLGHGRVGGGGGTFALDIHDCNWSKNEKKTIRYATHTHLTNKQASTPTHVPSIPQEKPILNHRMYQVWLDQKQQALVTNFT